MNLFSVSDFREIISGQRIGLAPAVFRVMLRAGEFPYRWVVSYRNRRFDNGKREIHSVAVPVISVGNLTVGGTGKTPCVAWLARWFRQHDVRVAIISRGYRAEEGKPNDEALELEQGLPDVPHLQNPNRVEAARTAIEELETQLIILDDGFQHRRLARDLDIVLIDALEPFGYGHLLPRGMLREPLGGMARADVICLSRCDLVSRTEREKILQRVRKTNNGAVLAALAHAPSTLLAANQQQRSLEQLRGTRVAAFCGIGNPTAFRRTLETCGAEVVAWRTFPDHHNFSREDVHRLVHWATTAEDISYVICTHKDLVKLVVNKLGTVPLYALAVEMSVTDGLEPLEAKLGEILRRISR